MDYRPMFEAIRTGASVPIQYVPDLIVGREVERKAIESDIEYITSTGNSKVRVFLGDYGFGKTTLGKYAEYIGKERGMLVSYLTEKDYQDFHKQDELFKSIMKNISLIGVEGNTLRVLMDVWAEDKVKEIRKSGLKVTSPGAVATYLQKNANLAKGMFLEFCAAYIFKMLRNEDTADLIAYIRGERIDRRVLKRVGIYHFLDEDGWNFLKAFAVLLKELEVPGMIIIMDELENLRGKRRDVRDAAYNQLRETVDKLMGGDVSSTYCMWLGTRNWFDSAKNGVASYQALHERVQNTHDIQTSQSVMLELEPMNHNEYIELLKRICKNYKDTYGLSSGSNSIPERIFESIKERYTDVNKRFSIPVREFVKFSVATLDIMKENPGEKLDFALQKVTVGPSEKDDLDSLFEEA